MAVVVLVMVMVMMAVVAYICNEKIDRILRMLRTRAQSWMKHR